MLADSPPEVSLPGTRQRRCHHDRSRNSAAQLPVLRHLQGQLDPPGCEDIGHSVHVAFRVAHRTAFRTTFRTAFPVTLRATLPVTPGVAPCPHPCALRCHERIVLRRRALARTHRQSGPFQGSPRRLRPWRLGERAVNLLRLPPRKGPALSFLPVSRPPAHMDCEPRRAHRPLPRHQHPDLRKPALLVDAELATAHVRRVVHLQHHLRQRVRVYVDGRPLQPHPVRVQIQHLVGLHQPAFAARRIQAHQVRRAEAHDPRPAQHRELSGNLRQLPRRLLVLNGGWFADLPGRLGDAVPELQTAFVAVDLARRQVERLAAGEVLRPVRRRPEDAVRTERIERSSAHVASRLMDGCSIPLPQFEYILPPEEAAGMGRSPDRVSAGVPCVVGTQLHR